MSVTNTRDRPALDVRALDAGEHIYLRQGHNFGTVPQAPLQAGNILLLLAGAETHPRYNVAVAIDKFTVPNLSRLLKDAKDERVVVVAAYGTAGEVTAWNDFRASINRKHRLLMENLAVEYRVDELADGANRGARTASYNTFINSLTNTINRLSQDLSIRVLGAALAVDTADGQLASVSIQGTAHIARDRMEAVMTKLGSPQEEEITAGLPLYLLADAKSDPAVIKFALTQRSHFSEPLVSVGSCVGVPITVGDYIVQLRAAFLGADPISLPVP